MTPEQIEKIDAFYDSELGPDWRSRQPEFLDGWQTVEALWPLNAVFRPHLELIKSLPYDASMEGAADAAILDYIAGQKWTADSPRPEVWRVLNERHTQAILLALANERQGNKRVIVAPKGLTAHQRTVTALLFLMCSMKLPFPIDESGPFVWPEGPPPASLRRH